MWTVNNPIRQEKGDGKDVNECVECNGRSVMGDGSDKGVSLTVERSGNRMNMPSILPNNSYCHE